MAPRRTRPPDYFRTGLEQGKKGEKKKNNMRDEKGIYARERNEELRN